MASVGFSVGPGDEWSLLIPIIISALDFDLCPQNPQRSEDATNIITEPDGHIPSATMLNTYETSGDKKKRGGGSTRSSGSGHHVPRRGAVSDDRRAERERQIAIMDTLISDFEQSTSGIGDELHLQILAGTVDQPGDMDGSTVGRRPAGGSGSGSAGRGGGPIVGNSGSHHGGALDVDREAAAPSGRSLTILINSIVCYGGAFNAFSCTIVSSLSRLFHSSSAVSFETQDVLVSQKPHTHLFNLVLFLTLTQFRRNRKCP